MRRSLFVVGVALLSAVAASAWPNEYPRYETFLGYNFVRFHPDSSFVPNFNANGGSGQFDYNFTKWIGVAADVGAVNKGVLNGLDFDTTVMHFVAGPRVTFRHSRWQPFGQVLFGGAYATTSAPVTVVLTNQAIIPPGFPASPNTDTIVRIHASNTGFAMMAGGGLDIKLSRHIAFRPVGVDYYLTRVPDLVTGHKTNWNNFRYSAGVNFLFGYPK